MSKLELALKPASVTVTRTNTPVDSPAVDPPDVDPPAADLPVVDSLVTIPAATVESTVDTPADPLHTDLTTVRSSDPEVSVSTPPSRGIKVKLLKISTLIQQRPCEVDPLLGLLPVSNSFEFRAL